MVAGGKRWMSVAVLAGTIHFFGERSFATWGACCHEPTNTCTNFLLPEECVGPDFRFGGAGSTCETMDPPCSCQPADCDDGFDCTVDSCEPVSDQCTHMPVDESCDNGLHCDGLEYCDPNSGCQAGVAPNCGFLDDQCLRGVCNEASDSCIAIPDNNGLPCDDGQACFIGELCGAGICGGGVPVSCPDNQDPCTDLICSPDGMEGNCDAIIPVNNGGDCDDGKVCDVGERCEDGLCVGGSPVVCPDNGDPCTDLACNAVGAEGNCSLIVVVNNGGACDDDPCNLGEVCAGGVCQGGFPVACPDNGDPCTDLACDPAGAPENCDDVVVVNDGSPCDDSDACNVGEICAGGLCLGGAPVVCPDDGLFCQDAICDSAGSEGNCAMPVPANEGVPCESDGLFCTAEICVEGKCVSASAPCQGALCCEAQDVCAEQCCTDEDCPGDGLFCNGPEICSTGLCVPSGSPCQGALCCEAQDVCAEQCCTDEDCPGDGLFCNGPETCSTGLCVPSGSPCQAVIEGCDEDGDLCFSTTVPTLNEWGLVVLGLMLLIASKVRGRLLE